VRVILVAYPCLMLFTLAYGGEHYVLDCIVGAALAWFAVWVNRAYDRWWAAPLVTAGQPWTEPAPRVSPSVNWGELIVADDEADYSFS
jgi:hypothetical protein